MKHEDTLESLDKEAAIIAEKRKALLAKTRDADLEKAKTLVKTYGFTAVELGVVAPTAKTTKVKPVKAIKAPKYIDPTNPEKMWAGGQGQRPKWVKEHLAKGGHLEDLLIKK